MKFKLIRGNQKPPIRLQIDFLVICHFPVWSRRVHREPACAQLPGPGADRSGSSPLCGLGQGSDSAHHPALNPPGPRQAQGTVASGCASAVHRWPTETRSLGVVGSLGSYPCLESVLSHPRASHAQSSGPGVAREHGRLLSDFTLSPNATL